MKAKLNFNHLGKFIQSKKIKGLVCWDVERNIGMSARTHNDKQAATVGQLMLWKEWGKGGRTRDSGFEQGLANKKGRSWPGEGKCLSNDPEARNKAEVMLAEWCVKRTLGDDRLGRGWGCVAVNTVPTRMCSHGSCVQLGLQRLDDKWEPKGRNQMTVLRNVVLKLGREQRCSFKDQ